MEEGKDTRDLTVKDASGKVIGRYKDSVVLGWSIEREPVDLTHLSAEELDRLSQDLEKHGYRLPPGISVIIDGAGPD